VASSKDGHPMTGMRRANFLTGGRLVERGCGPGL